MKKSVFISGILCTFCMHWGCIFKVQHWPGANVMITLSCVLFCFHFLPVSLFEGYKESGKYRSLYLITFIVFFIGMGGVLFKIMHWPGASFLILPGVTLPFVLFLPVYLYQTRFERNRNLQNYTAIMFALIFLAVFSALLTINPSKKTLAQIQSSINRNTLLEKLLHAQTAPSASSNQISEISAELVKHIEKLKQEMVTESGASYKHDLGSTNFQPLICENPENSFAVKKVLYKGQPDSSIHLLLDGIKELKQQIQKSPGISAPLKELASAILPVYTDFNVEEQKGNQSGKSVINGYLLINALDDLTSLQADIRTIAWLYNQEVKI